MESLGTSLIEALMILVEFMPILFGLSMVFQFSFLVIGIMV
jgi:peptide/bleomycin uptake transporter